MSVGLYVRMLYILLLCPALMASGVLTLTIDSQLGTSVEGKFYIYFTVFLIYIYIICVNIIYLNL